MKNKGDKMEEITKNFNTIEFYNEDVKMAMLKAHELGFEIYISNREPLFERDKKISYFNFKDKESDALAYFEYSRFNIFNGCHFSTCHKPNRETGSGWRVFDNIFNIKNSHFIDTIERAKENLKRREKAPDFEKFLKEHVKIKFN